MQWKINLKIIEEKPGFISSYFKKLKHFYWHFVYKGTTAVERRLGSLFASSDGGGQSASEASSRLMLRPVLASLRWVARAVAARKRASVASESTLVLPHIGLESSDASVPSLGLQYEVGFSDDLFLVLSEAEMMEHLGLQVKPKIKNAAVQRAAIELSVRSLRYHFSSITCYNLNYFNYFHLGSFFRNITWYKYKQFELIIFNLFLSKVYPIILLIIF